MYQWHCSVKLAPIHLNNKEKNSNLLSKTKKVEQQQTLESHQYSIATASTSMHIKASIQMLLAVEN
jgi:hypothetical protein